MSCIQCENKGMCEWAMLNVSCWTTPKTIDLSEIMRCDLAPPGWRCNLDKGHDGPCPAWPDTLWLKIKWAWYMKSLSILVGRHL